MKAERSGIGGKIRALRKDRRLTLAMLSKRSGYSVSALSKMENEHLGLSYDKLTRLAVALEVDLSTLFSDEPQLQATQAPAGRRSIARKGAGKFFSTGNYDYLYIATDLSKKQMVPLITTVHATNLEEFGPLVRHGGEEWIYVLKGQIEVHSEYYAPEVLGEGDSIYLDSRMGHAYVAKSEGGAQLVSICSAPEAELLENADAQAKRPKKRRSTAARAVKVVARGTPRGGKKGSR